jgi:glucose/arabinose dehydrogenase
MFRRIAWIGLMLQLAACGSDESKEDSGLGTKDATTSTPSTPSTPDSSTRPSDAMDAMTMTPPVTPAHRDAGMPPATPPPARDAGRPPTETPMDAAPSGDAQAPDSGNTMTADAGAGPVGKTCVGTSKLDAYVSDPKLCVYTFATNLTRPRQMAFAPNGDLFVNASGVIVLWDADKNGASDANERAMFGQASMLNHGIAFSRDKKFLYASSMSTVFRWPYSMGQRMAQGAAETVIRGIPSGGHNTRSLAFDSQNRLIVSIGSAGNVDTSQTDWDTRSQIRRYTIPETIPMGGLAYMTGEVLASGMRNEAGIFVDDQDRIWGVENGRDNLEDGDMGGDIHNDNPGEEINLVDGKGPKYYGYPHCYTEFRLDGGGGPGTQWADQTLSMSMRKSDDYCRDAAQVRAPVHSMPAHWAPLGIIRYSGRALPMTGDMIIGAHGSWNRSPATGRVIARARMEGDEVTALDVIVGEKDGSGQVRQGQWNVRPVDVQQGPDEAVYFSDDMGGRVIKIGYEQ